MALAIDTMIPTPDGWTPLGDLRPGDIVFTHGGKPQRVMKCGEIRTAPCYRVRFASGAELVTDARQSWEVMDGYHDHCRDMRTTADLTHAKSGRYSIRVAEPLQCPEKNVPVAPWALGYWLSSGTSTTAQVSAKAQDAEHVAERFRRLGLKVTCRIRNGTVAVFGIGGRGRDQCGWDHPPEYRDATGYCRLCAAERFQARCAGRKRPGPVFRTFLARLTEAGLIGNRQIPAVYLRASITQRLELLRGMADGRGTYTVDRGAGRLTITVRPPMCLAVLELCRTLGHRPNARPNRSNIEVRLYPHAGDPDLPMTLPRLVERLTARTPRCRSEFHFLTGIEPVESVPVRDVVLDSWSGTYLASEAMIAVKAASA